MVYSFLLIKYIFEVTVKHVCVLIWRCHEISTRVLNEFLCRYCGIVYMPCFTEKIKMKIKGDTNLVFKLYMPGLIHYEITRFYLFVLLCGF